MIDENKLIEEIRNMVLPLTIPEIDDGTTLAYNEALADVLNTIEEQPKVDGWIPVEERLPFKPKEGGLYYFISLDNGDAMGAFYCSGMSHHKLRVKSGNCYCTREEAEKHSDEWMSKIYGENWKELLK